MYSLGHCLQHLAGSDDQVSLFNTFSDLQWCRKELMGAANSF
jgi:hypothetical protein